VPSDRPLTGGTGFRYGFVFFITLGIVVYAIAAPEAPRAHAVVVGLEAMALAVVMATSRAREEVRRLRAIAVTAAGTLVVVLAAADVLSDAAVFAVAGALAIAVPSSLVGGLARLIRDRGVTLRAVGGALTIYLYVGLVFAWTYALISAVTDVPFFAQGAVQQGDRVYFSFTTLTTTGYGDLTPATQLGHALAVVEMLTGQLYLVTVIGVLVGDLVGRRRTG
jgi:hypothetical protein